MKRIFAIILIGCMPLLLSACAKTATNQIPTVGKELNSASKLVESVPSADSIASAGSDSADGKTTGSAEADEKRKEAFTSIGQFADGLYPVKKNGYWGYADANYNIVIDCIYQKCEPFVHQRGIVKRSQRYGVVDQTGALILPTKYNQIDKITEKLIIAVNGQNPDKSREVYTINGKVVFPGVAFAKCKAYDSVERIVVDELFFNSYDRGYNRKIYSYSGKEVFDGSKYGAGVSAIGDFNDGWALVDTIFVNIGYRSHYFNFVNPDGKFLIDGWAGDACAMSDGRALVSSLTKEKNPTGKDDNNWMVIDKNGKKIGDLPDGALKYTRLFHNTAIGSYVSEGISGSAKKETLLLTKIGANKVLYDSFRSVEPVEGTDYIIVKDNQTNLYGLINANTCDIAAGFDYDKITYDGKDFLYRRGAQESVLKIK